MAEDLIVEVELGHLPAAVVVTVRGELDLSTIGTLRAALEPRDPAWASAALVFNLAGLDFCDSSGIGALVAVYHAAVAAGGSVYVTALRPRIADLLTMTALDQLLIVEADAATVLSNLADTAPPS